jgi:hypothetical protein
MERIKSEIKNLIDEWRCCNSAEAKYRCEAYGELLEYINSLQEDPVSNDLEEAARKMAARHSHITGDVYYANDAWFFKKGAQWQKKQCQKTIKLAEDNAYLAGQEKVIDKACEFIETYPHLFMGVLRSEVIEDFKNYIKKSKL